MSFIGLAGIGVLLTIAFFCSNNRKTVDWSLVGRGLTLQFFLAVFILKFPIGQALFATLGEGVKLILEFADAGAGFVFGPLVTAPDTLDSLFGSGSGFIFAFRVIPTIIFVSTLVAMAYHLGWIQQVVKWVAWLVYRLMGASGAEALSNTASAFVGQVEAQLLIKPYVATLTQSELLAVMSGSMACIAGGVMAVYIGLGIPAEYLIAASAMAIPGSLVMAKLMVPETEISPTRGDVSITLEKKTVNLIDAAAHGASDGLKIGLAVVGMLIAFVALITMGDFLIGRLGEGLANLFFTDTPAIFGPLDLRALTLGNCIGLLFSPLAWLLGIPAEDTLIAGSLMGTKMVVNEFVAYTQLVPLLSDGTLSTKTVTIVCFALCGFANVASIAVQIGGIGEMAPSRKRDLARFGIHALLCGTMTSYVSGAMAGLLIGLPVITIGGVDLLPIILMTAAIGVLWLLSPQPSNNRTIQTAS